MDAPPAYRSVYLTFPDLASARRVAGALIDARLVACVNLVPGVTSVYRWDGAVVEESEVVAFAKTRAELVDAVTATVRELHPYDLPCVVALPLVGGSAPYLAWVGEETSEAAGPA